MCDLFGYVHVASTAPLTHYGVANHRGHTAMDEINVLPRYRGTCVHDVLVMLRLSMRVAKVCSLRASSIKWSHGRWSLRCKVKGGREEVWPLPKARPDKLHS